LAPREELIVTTPYVRKGKLPACRLNAEQLTALFYITHGPEKEPGLVEIAVEHQETVEGKMSVRKEIFTTQAEFVQFMASHTFLESFIVGFNYRGGSDQTLISFINTPTPGGSLYIFGEQAWVDQQFVALANFFNQCKNTTPTLMFNGFTGKIVSTVIPMSITAFLITATLAIALPTLTRIEYFGILTVASIFGTFKFGLILSEYLIKKLGEKYPYFFYTV
jgi:hypothetical protein